LKDKPTTKTDWAALIVSVGLRQDHAAFRLLFDFFAPRIKGYLMKTGSSQGEAEEIAQDALIAVWRKAGKFDPGSTGAAGWIFTIARNLRIDAVRRGRRCERVLREVEAEYLPEHDEGAEAAVVQGQNAARVEAALNRLSAEQSEVVRLSFIEQRPHAEIAKLLRMPLGTVKSRIRLALTRLRELLDDSK
jgi:RNA polymerase sigma factor (sigma-70 family)